MGDRFESHLPIASLRCCERRSLDSESDCCTVAFVAATKATAGIMSGMAIPVVVPIEWSFGAGKIRRDKRWSLNCERGVPQACANGCS
jgi:hypothetical protein